MNEWQSNARWPLDTYKGIYGDGVSTDRHRSKEAARCVCDALQLDGFGGMREVFPLEVWVSEVCGE